MITVLMLALFFGTIAYCWRDARKEAAQNARQEHAAGLHQWRNAGL
jgi:cbb3-type cytochrome oxidase subunit 3